MTLDRCFQFLCLRVHAALQPEHGLLQEIVDSQHLNLTAPWDALGAEPFVPVCKMTAGGRPNIFCTSVVL